MTDAKPTIARGDEYIVFYTDGPYDGRNDRRISTDGSWDEELTVLVALDGKETQIVYGSPEAHAIGDQVQVTYTFDPSHGEPIEDPDERISEQ
jgi:hypothetical protein